MAGRTKPLRENRNEVINLYRDRTKELWHRAERKVREEHDADDVSKGEVAAQAFAIFLGVSGPLDSGKHECPVCGERVSLPTHLPKEHPDASVEIRANGN